MTPLLRGPRLALALVTATGCGSWGRVGTQPEPTPAETLTQILDVNATYRRLGRLTGPAPVPFVASVAFFGGGGDSTVAVVSLSLESRNLLFQRDGDGFLARYRVEITATPVGEGAPVRSARDQTVRVSRFAETQRNDESVLYQEGLTLTAGAWRIAVEVADQGGAKTSRAEAEFKVPAFGPGTLTAPALAYQVRGRGSRSAPVAIILNPRGALAYGGDSAIAYVEAYQLAGPARVPITVIDARDSVVLRDVLPFEGGREVESSVIRFAPSTTSLGELRIVAGTGEGAPSSTALVSFSSGWVITNFEDMISLLRYFPPSVELDSLRKAAPGNRARLWQVFYRNSDPNSATPANEHLDRYFARLAYANQRFRDEGTQGWRTDRGEVLIRLGEPDEIFDASPTSEGRLIRWGFTRYNLTLYFVDESGFGRFKLVPSSRAALENVAWREVP
jgi:GWxTD domain-containing protein